MKWPPLSCQKMWVKGARLKPKGKRKWKDCTSKWQGCVWSLLIYRGQEQDRRGWELGEKRHRKQEILTPLPPSQTCFNTKTTNCANASLHKKTQQTRVYIQVNMTDVFSLLVDSSCFTSLGVQVHVLQKFAYLQFWTFRMWRNWLIWQFSIYIYYSKKIYVIMILSVW